MDGSLVGRNYSLVEKQFLPLLLVQRVARLRTLSTMSQEYLFHWISSINFIKYVDSVKTSSGIPHISSKDINNFKILIPSLPEQQKIASILSTWDKAVAKQEALITQKEHLKKGLMQELLTGKKRFAGFEEEWKEVKLGKVAKIIMGQSPDSSSYNEESKGKYLIQGNADIKNRKSAPRIWTSKPTKVCEVGDILMTVRAPVGAIAKSIHNACIGRGICSIKFKENNDFLYFKLLQFENSWKRLEQGSTFSAVGSNDIRTLKFLIPNSIKEQQKIADILSFADKEIENLKTQHATMKLQKQGLMQELLTGKRRVKLN
jgi:type I restriction enzyme S subunit